MDKEFSLKGLTALVTGGASGLGEAAVLELSTLGCNVAILDMDNQKGNKLVENLKGKNVIFIYTDVSNEQSIQNAIEKIIETFKEIHIVLNVAGIASGFPIEHCTTEMLLQTYSVNVFGTFWVCKYSVIQMKKQGYINKWKERGYIINVSSEQAKAGQQARTVYSGTKGAVNSMTLPLSRELGPYGIRVVTIAPATFCTPLVEKHHTKEEIDNDFSGWTSLGRIGEPEEFAKCVVSICFNSFLTGCVIRLDGGMRTPNYVSKGFTKF